MYLGYGFHRIPDSRNIRRPQKIEKKGCMKKEEETERVQENH
jgi:hypothetical protein